GRGTTCRAPTTTTPRGPPRNEKETLLIAGKAFCNASRDRHLELLMLVRLHHEQDAEDERNQANEAVQRPTKPESAESAHHHEPFTKDNPDDDVKDVEPP